MTVILLAAIQGYKFLTVKLQGKNRYIERKGKINFTPWWWTGRPGVLRFMGSQRGRHDWAAQLNWTQSKRLGFPGGSVVKNLPANTLRAGFDSWVRKIPWRRKSGNRLQYSCLGNPMDRETWRAMVQGSQRVGCNWAAKQHQQSKCLGTSILESYSAGVDFT